VYIGILYVKVLMTKYLVSALYSIAINSTVIKPKRINELHIEKHATSYMFVIFGHTLPQFQNTNFLWVFCCL